MRQVVAVVCRLVLFVVECFPAVWGLAVVVVAAEVVVVAQLERYRRVDFANRVFDFANRACRLGLVAPARFPFVRELGVAAGLAGVVAAVATVERYREVDFVRQAVVLVSRLALALPVCLPAGLVPVVVWRVAGCRGRVPCWLPREGYQHPHPLRGGARTSSCC